MTEINKDLSLSGLNFGNSKQVKKEQPAEEKAPNAEPVDDKTNLDIAPGAIYGRVGIKGPKGTDATKECVAETVKDYKKRPDMYALSDMLFKTIYEESIAEGLSESESYQRAAEAAHRYLTDAQAKED